MHLHGGVRADGRSGLANASFRQAELSRTRQQKVAFTGAPEAIDTYSDHSGGQWIFEVYQNLQQDIFPFYLFII